jgi:hypothetical protein
MPAEAVDQYSQASGSGSSSPLPPSSLPVRKRKQAMQSVQHIIREAQEEMANEKRSATFPDIGEEQWDSEDNDDSDTAKEGFASHMDGADAEGGGRQGDVKGLTGKAREIRLEQNRKAARESRRRKKMMIEELQRSVIFFSKRNAALKKENEDLTRMLLQAQNHIQAKGGNTPLAGKTQAKQEQQQQQHAVPTTSVSTNSVAVSEQQHAVPTTSVSTNSVAVSEQQQQVTSEAQHAMHQLLLSQLNAASAMQHGGGSQIKSENSIGQQSNTVGGKSTQDLQVAAIQAMVAARNILPPTAAGGGFGFDPQGNSVTNPFGQFMGQQFQVGQQFFPMSLGAVQSSGGLGAPNPSYGIPFPYGVISPQHFFQFPGVQGVPNLQQQQQPQSGQQQNQEQQKSHQ